MSLLPVRIDRLSVGLGLLGVVLGDFARGLSAFDAGDPEIDHVLESPSCGIARGLLPIPGPRCYLLGLCRLK